MTVTRYFGGNLIRQAAHRHGQALDISTSSSADLPNPFYLRTIEDADRLKHAIDQSVLPARGKVHRDHRRRTAGHRVAASLAQLDQDVHLIVAVSIRGRSLPARRPGNL